MWTISMLKQNAKAALKNFYWTAVLVTLIVSLLGGGGGGGSSAGGGSTSSGADSSISDAMEQYIGDDSSDIYYDYGDGNSDDYYDDYSDDYYDDYDDSSSISSATAAILGAVGVIMIVVIIIAFAFSAFISMPVTVGQNKFYLDARCGDVGVGKIFNNFKSGSYLATVGTMVIMNLKIFLWTLLFVIPGIIKTYEYILVPYIIAENPQIDRKRAFEISKQTMEGEKMNCWVLQLSFFGWFFLGAITIIGNLFIMPYYNATMAEFYSCMKQKALSTGIASSYELGDDFGGFGNSSQIYSAPGTSAGGYDNSQSMTHYQPTTSYTSNPQQPGAMDEISTSPDDVNSDNYNGPEIK